MYDCIKLEAGDIVTGIDGITIKDAPADIPAKYLDNGRIVIEKAGKRYTADGKRLVL